jgi:polyphenol oxidase
MNEATVLRSAVLDRAGFLHGFTTRAGGVSPEPFDTLDLSLMRDRRALAENQRRLARAVAFELDALRQVTQVHGARIVDAADACEGIEADAIVAEPGSGLAVMVRVADCVPVLLADRATGRVAAVHAGWRGLALGIVTSAAERLKGHLRADVVAAIGPCIGPCCFEVGDDVAAAIGRGARVRPSSAGKSFVDLRAAVRADLLACGVQVVEDVGGCTRCDRDRFYSYRRDGDASGRLGGVIVAR